jgi:hypothetical protein
MAKEKEEPKVVQEVFRVPWDASKILTEITSQARLKTGVKITKTAILAELLHMLREAKIDSSKVATAEDVIERLKEKIRAGK